MSSIPKGFYCYSGGEWDAEAQVFKTTPCPFWERTSYGTVKCHYLKEESLTCEAGESNDEVRAKAYEHFGGKEATWEVINVDSLLWDAVKSCSENYGYEEE